MGCKLHLTADDLQHLSDTFRNLITYNKWNDTYSVHGSNVLSAEQMKELINGFFFEQKDSYINKDKGDLFEEAVIIAMENQGFITMFPGSQRTVEGGRGGYDAVFFNPTTDEVVVVDAKDYGEYLRPSDVTAHNNKNDWKNMNMALTHVENRDDYPADIKERYQRAIEEQRFSHLVIKSSSTRVTAKTEAELSEGYSTAVLDFYDIPSLMDK